jgi:hypothetical protein
MFENRKLLVVSMMLLLLVAGASAAKFVIHDKDASLSLAATPDHDVAFSVVIAENPNSYSASMSADDSSGASASQKSDIGGADYIFSASAAVDSEGDTAYTATETYQGNTETTQSAHASQGNSVSVTQDTTSIALAGASVSNATDSDGNSASQCIAFLVGFNDVNLTADTSNSATATQSGLFVGLFAHSLGFAETPVGDTSYTDAFVNAGGMTFDNTATASGTTSASQDLTMAGILGSANAGSTDSKGNFASQSAGFIGGILDVDQSTNTDASATAAQSGLFAGLSAGTFGLASSSDGDISATNAGVFTGGMTFDDTATAHDTTTTASQDVTIAGLLGSAHAGSLDQSGNIATQDTGFVAGVLNTDQTTNTQNSATAAQVGDFIGIGALTNGFALSTEGDISHTYAGVFTGGMTFDDTATAEDTNTTASQDVIIAGLLGSAHAGSIDQNNNIATQDAVFAAGVLNTDQTTDTLDSANAAQEGGFVGLGATTNGFALSSDGDISLTHAGVFTGAMTFDDSAKAQATNTTASQNVMLAGLLGQAGADSFDHGKIATQDTVFAAGVLNADQTADTLDSAHAVQNGTFIGAGAMTAGFAIAQDKDVSHTTAGVLVGEMTFDNEATAEDTNTTASQDVKIAGLLGSAHAGSLDQSGNIATQDTGFVAGVLNTDQTADTLNSANALQTGDFVGLGAITHGFALAANGDVSDSNAGVLAGEMAFNNEATAQDTFTSAGHTVNMSALAGFASVRSDDGINITEEGSGIILGSLDVTQEATTTASAHAFQSGTMDALYGTTWGEATNEAQQSWTTADIVVGTMTFDNNATADGTTKAGQTLSMTALLGNASAGSNDGMGNVTSLGSGIIIGTKNVTQEVNTSGSAHAVQSGTMDALYGTTWGEATSGAEESWTKADVVVGTMTFDNNATADGQTEAGQAVDMAALYGNASAGSDDGMGNITEQGAGIILSTMNVSQEANTTGSAHAIQNGNITGGYGFTWGSATNTGGGDNSWTKADVLIGTMTFDNSATANEATSVTQSVQVPLAAAANASAGSTGSYGTTEVGAGIIVGTMNVDQAADTDFSATQTGNMTALLGSTWGSATIDANNSWTEANILLGTMNFTNSALIGGDTEVTQHVEVPFAVAGNASAGSTDGTNTTEVGAGYLVGLFVDVNQEADTTGSTHATQNGIVPGLVTNTWAEATSGSESSWTNSNVFVGLISVGENTAIANGDTKVFQSVNVTGISGNATAGSTDGINITNEGVELVAGNLTALGDINWTDVVSGNITDTSDLLVVVAKVVGQIGGGGYLDVDQQADTSGSAHANQTGNVYALGNAHTWGEAISGANQSWTSSNVTTGLMRLDNNTVVAAGSTSARQDFYLTGLAGNASVGSTDGTNSTSVGTQLSNGIWITSSLDLDQRTSTTGSALASQSGTVTAIVGTGGIWGEASSGTNRSWTSSNVTTGSINVNTNNVYAGSTTNGSQIVQNVGVSGDAWVGSTDGTSYAKVGAGYTNGGYLSADKNIVGLPSGYLNQQTSTSASAKANQTGMVSSLGTTYGNAWTRTEAGNTSGRLVYVETDAKTNSALIGPVFIKMINSTAYSSLVNSTAYESKTRAGLSTASTTYDFAANGILPNASGSSPSGTTNTWAWATDTNKFVTYT